MGGSELQRARAQYASQAAPAASLEEARHLMESFFRGDPLPTGVSVAAQRVGEVNVERFTPAAARPGSIVYAHGGGYVAGSLVTHRALTAEIAAVTLRTIIAVDYRRAPEHPFPAAVDDVAAVFRAVCAEHPEAGVALAGDSAGGGLALSVVAQLKERRLRLPSALVLIGPWVDLRLTGKSFALNKALDPLVTVEALSNSAAAYVGGGDMDHPWLVPLQSGLRGYPPLLIQVGSAEGLLDDSVRLAERAQSDGVSVTLQVWPEMMHTWHRYSSYLPQATEALAAIKTFIDGIFPTPSSV
jgi:acetyl esterase/lipase